MWIFCQLSLLKFIIDKSDIVIATNIIVVPFLFCCLEVQNQYLAYLLQSPQDVDILSIISIKIYN